MPTKERAGGLRGIALADADDAAVRAALDRDGVVLIEGAFSRAECRALVAAIDSYAAKPKLHDARFGIYPRAFEHVPAMLDLLVDPRILRWARVMLGPHVRVMDQRIFRNPRGVVSASGFHIDRDLLFPCGPRQARHPPEAKLPIFWGQVRLYLSEATTDADGPTRYVLGSHYSGRFPNDPERPTFEGRGVTTVYYRPGDLVLHNGQVWHAAVANQRGRRYFVNNVYCRPFMAHDLAGVARHAILPRRIARHRSETVRTLFGLQQIGAREDRLDEETARSSRPRRRV